MKPNPINLSVVLNRYGISQKEWREHIRLNNGKVLSPASANRILRYNHWLRKTPRDVIKKQTYAFLNGRVPTTQINKTLWQVANHDTGAMLKKMPARSGIDSDTTALTSDDVFNNTPEVVMLSQHAIRHFNLNKDPFRNEIRSISDVYKSVDVREVLVAMRQTAEFGGVMALTVESGGGKTVIKDTFVHESDPEHTVIVESRIIDKSKATPNMFLEAIIRDVNPSQKIPVSSEAKARLALSVLRDATRANTRVVFIQDEAHKHHKSIFPFYKQLSEMQSGFNKLLGIILIGQPELKQHLHLGTNWESREFINRCDVMTIPPMDACLEDYVAFKFDRIGCDINTVIDSDSYDWMRANMFHYFNEQHKTSTLYPLFINNKLTQAMNLCAEINQPKITAKILEKA